jgi:hypothetical protein
MELEHVGTRLVGVLTSNQPIVDRSMNTLSLKLISR